MDEATLGNFVDGTSITIAIVLSVFLLFFIVMLVFSVIDHRKLERILKNSVKAPIHICYHVENKKIIAFLENSANSLFETDLDSFLINLSYRDQERVKNWLYSIERNLPDAPNFLRTHIPSIRKDERKPNKTTGGLLELTGVNEDRSKLYITLHTLHFVPFDQTKWKNNYNTVIRQLSNFIFSNKEPTGLYFINLSLIDDPSYVSNKEPVAYTLIIDRLYKSVLGRRNTRIYELDADIILIVEIPHERDFDYEGAGRDWLKFVNNIIQTNFWGNKIKASMGLITSDAMKRGTRSIIEEGKKLAESAEDVPADEEAFVMYKASNQARALEENYESALKKILDGKNVSYLYQGIINPSTSRIFGYTTFFKTKNSIFDEFEDTKRYAIRHGDGHELFVEYVSKCCKFFEEREIHAARLFINIVLEELDYALNAMPHIPRKTNYNVIFVINEESFEKDSIDLNDIISKIKQLQQLDYEVAIQLDHENLLLSFDLYRRFDYFIVPNIKRDSGSRNDSRVQIYYTRLLESLLKYKKPIISLGAENWFMVELLVRLGIDYISSQEISPFNLSLKDIDRRKLSRLNKYSE